MSFKHPTSEPTAVKRLDSEHVLVRYLQSSKIYLKVSAIIGMGAGRLIV